MSTERNTSSNTVWIVGAGLVLSLGVGLFLILHGKNKIPGLIAKKLFKTKYNPLIPFVIAQAKVETDDFSSDAFKRANNLFGMKNASAGRKQSQLGFEVPGDKYRHYNNLEESVQDFLNLLNYDNFPIVNSVSGYAANWKRLGYYETPVTQYQSLLESKL